MQPEDLLRLAERLQKSENEVEQRTAVNRAYYCAHHALQTIVSELPQEEAPVIPGRVGHREVFRRLEKWKHPKRHIEGLKPIAVATSKVLHAMIVARENADYRIHVEHDPREAELQIDRSKRVLRFVANVVSRRNEAA